MKLRSKLALGLAVLAMGAVPTVAGASGPEYAPEQAAQDPSAEGPRLRLLLQRRKQEARQRRERDRLQPLRGDAEAGGQPAT